ncbi:glycosyltransferase [Hymenobacter sp. B81]|uniref:glycosyltransferase n=1 Tax=Hymenobacter sp. B81 TaxID=3344878 RepID=UPI0037DD7781
MPAPLPSVLLSIVTWNSADSIEACLRSVLAQSHADFTVWVVDNASTDDTCALVAALAATDARLHLHALPENTGFCGGHNYTLDRTHSDAVLLVNPDIVLPPDYLAGVLAVLQRDERIGTVVGVLVQSLDEPDPVIDSAGMNALPDGRFQLRYHGRRLSEVPLRADLEDVAGADGALPLYRRRFIDDLRVEGQFFDERFFAHKEDWDISWRSQLYGWRTVLAPHCRALHPRHFRPADLRLRRRLSSTMKADAVKNQLLLLLKNPAPHQLLLTWLRALPRQAAILLFALLVERKSLRAYAYLRRHWREVWATRQQVQARAAEGWHPPVAATDAKIHQPLLSICVPCYHRPELLARALRSIGPLPADVEIVVSDNSVRDNHCEQMTRYVLAHQPVSQWRYFRNAPGSNATDNWQLCLRRARGRYVLMLHDDDFLLPNGLTTIMQTLRSQPDRYAALLFGVVVVDENRRPLRTQRVRRQHFLAPAAAVEQVLTNSSLVRMPAMVASRDACRSLGLDPSQQDTDDTDLWARLFAAHGVLRVPACVGAYTVHEAAMTTGMFDAPTVQRLLRIFQKMEATGVLTAPRLQRARTHFFHQFILAGAYRALRRHDRPAARRILALFTLPQVRELPTPARWLPARLALTALSRLGWHLPAGRLSNLLREKSTDLLLNH